MNGILYLDIIQAYKDIKQVLRYVQSAACCTEAQKADILAAQSVNLSLRFLFL